MSSTNGIPAGFVLDNGVAYRPRAAAAERALFSLTAITITGDDVFHLGQVVNIPVGGVFQINATTALPDGQYMLIAERMTDGNTVQGDSRLKAVVSNGMATCRGKFNLSGNYVLRAARQNEGLTARGFSFEVEFATIDIDAYENV